MANGCDDREKSNFERIVSRSDIDSPEELPVITLGLLTGGSDLCQF
jgi:hypothetical protein